MGTHSVSVPSECLWLIKGDPVLDSRSKGLEAEVGVGIEVVNNISVQPSILIVFSLEHMR